MHQNNIEVINTYNASELAELYREYVNNWGSVENWASSILPESVTMEQAVAFKEICEACHNLGL